MTHDSRLMTIRSGDMISMHGMKYLWPAAVVVATIAGCRTEAGRAAARPVVDSTLSRDEALARFRQGIASTDTLAGGADSRDALAQAWVSAVAHADANALRDLVLTRAEFAWVFYPTSPQGLPPYDLPPGLMWGMLTRQTEKGIGYELKHLAGKPLGFVRVDCGDAPSQEGENRVWGPCLMTIAREDSGDSLRARLTGPIVERHGRFKFVSYTNNLD